MAIRRTSYAVGLFLTELCVGFAVRTHSDVGQTVTAGVRPTGVSVAELVTEGRARIANLPFADGGARCL
jgi:hypothetical protein